VAGSAPTSSGYSAFAKGRRCEQCGERKIHRPASAFYDERDGHLWHVPWFYTPRLCRDCGFGRVDVTFRRRLRTPPNGATRPAPRGAPP
jgi:hypothetical protein